ncbi:hypothetical protein FOZ62_011876, partial [Perkinsus olseni]
YPHDAEGFVRHGRVPVDWSPVFRDEPGVDHGRCKVCCAARGQLVKPEDLESLHSHEDDDNELQIPRSATWILATATHGDDQIRPGPIEPGVLNLCATTIGAGMLALPKAFASCGVFIG